MSLERLWAEWRGAHVSSAGEEGGASAAGDGGCILCRITAPGADREQYVLWRGQYSAAVLNAFPYTSGHLMGAPLRHCGDLERLHQEESVELWAGVTMAVVAIKAAYRPDGLNIGVN